MWKKRKRHFYRYILIYIILHILFLSSCGIKRDPHVEFQLNEYTDITVYLKADNGEKLKTSKNGFQVIGEKISAQGYVGTEKDYKDTEQTVDQIKDSNVLIHDSNTLLYTYYDGSGWTSSYAYYDKKQDAAIFLDTDEGTGADLSELAKRIYLVSGTLPKKEKEIAVSKIIILLISPAAAILAILIFLLMRKKKQEYNDEEDDPDGGEESYITEAFSHEEAEEYGTNVLFHADLAKDKTGCLAVYDNATGKMLINPQKGDHQYYIGRNPKKSEIVLAQDGAISGRHCSITVRKGSMLLKDEGSTNGTYRNGKRLETPEYLEYGDIIELGTRQLFIGKYKA